MKGYQKLAIFLAVLLFSVGLMSTAIEILGDLSEVEFTTGTKLVAGVESGTEKGEEELRQTQAVGSSAGALFPASIAWCAVAAPGSVTAMRAT